MKVTMLRIEARTALGIKMVAQLTDQTTATLATTVLHQWLVHHHPELWAQIQAAQGAMQPSDTTLEDQEEPV